MEKLLLRFGQPPRHLRHEEVGEDLEGGPVHLARPTIAQQEQLAQDAAPTPVERARRLHPLPAVGVELAGARLLGDEPRKLRLRLRGEAALGKLRRQLVAHGQEVLHVGEGVLQLLGRERAAAPVAALLVDGELHAHLIGEQVVQPDLLDPQRLGGGVGIEDAAEAQPVVALHAEHVVLGGVEDDLPRRIGEQRQERVELERQRVHREVRGLGGHLQQANLLVVGVEAVGLGVERDARALRHRGDAGLQLLRCLHEGLRAIHDARLYRVPGSPAAPL